MEETIDGIHVMVTSDVLEVVDATFRFSTLFGAIIICACVFGKINYPFLVTVK